MNKMTSFFIVLLFMLGFLPSVFGGNVWTYGLNATIVNSTWVNATQNVCIFGSYCLSNFASYTTTGNDANYVLRNDWTTINNYPTACGATDFVRGIGDTLTCATPDPGFVYANHFNQGLNTTSNITFNNLTINQKSTLIGNVTINGTTQLNAPLNIVIHHYNSTPALNLSGIQNDRFSPVVSFNIENKINWSGDPYQATPIRLTSAKLIDQRNLSRQGSSSTFEYVRVADFSFNRNGLFNSYSEALIYAIIYNFEMEDVGNYNNNTHESLYRVFNVYGNVQPYYTYPLANASLSYSIFYTDASTFSIVPSMNEISGGGNFVGQVYGMNLNGNNVLGGIIGSNNSYKLYGLYYNWGSTATPGNAYIYQNYAVYASKGNIALAGSVQGYGTENARQNWRYNGGKLRFGAADTAVPEYRPTFEMYSNKPTASSTEFVFNPVYNVSKIVFNYFNNNTDVEVHGAGYNSTLLVDYSTAFVGIRTAYPNSTLHVSGNITAINGTFTETLKTANLTISQNLTTGTIAGSGTTLGCTVKTGADTACTTTCGTGCLFGQDTAALTYTIVSCSDATADRCLCC
jgi:hypothetical protein